MDEETPYKGFEHWPDPAMIEEFRKWPAERKLGWLAAGARLRNLLPARIREIQDEFRRGER